MNDKMYAAMLEATRLTREGRLNEATLLIQRTLGLGHTPARASTDVVDEPELIEERFRLTAEPVAAPAASDTDGRVPTEAEDVRPTVAERPVDAATTARRATIRRPAVSIVHCPVCRCPVCRCLACRCPVCRVGTSRARAGPAAGPGGGPVDRGDPYQRGRDARLQTLYPQRVSRAGHAAGRDAPRLHPRPRRFRRRHRHELPGGGELVFSSPIPRKLPAPMPPSAGTGSRPPTSSGTRASLRSSPASPVR